jgi:hypothetical protein
MSVLALLRTDSNAASDVQAMKVKLVDYWNAVASINANAHTIVNTNLRKVDETGAQPEWWDGLSKNFHDCQSHAQVWLDTIYPSLTRVPQSIIHYNMYFNLTSQRILQLVTKLASGTPSEEDKRKLIELLTLLVTKLGASKTAVRAVRDDIKSFTALLAADHVALTTGASSVSQALKADEEEVKKINLLIEEIRSAIKDLNFRLGLAEGGLGLAITVGIVGAFFLPWLFIPLAIIGAGASIAAIVILSDQLAEKQTALEAEVKKVGKIALQVIVLQAIAASVDVLTDAIDDINDNIEVVADTWEKLEGDLGAIIEKLSVAPDQDWSKIITKGFDIAAAREAWKHLADFASDLQKVEITADATVVPLPRRAA